MAFAERLKTLRKKNKITQEQLAEYLSISPQGISKWETGQSSPDIDMLLRLAIVFGTSVDDLLDFDQRKLEQEVDELVKQSVPLREEPATAEAFYRNALQTYPNNEVLLNCLLAVMGNDRCEERIQIAEQLLDCTRDDEIKYDTLRLLAQTYHQLGQQAMAEHCLSQIPELYFLKTELAAVLRTGEAQQEAIAKTERYCFGCLSAMLLLSKETQHSAQDLDGLEQRLMDVFRALFGEAAANRLHEQYESKALLNFYR